LEEADEILAQATGNANQDNAQMIDTSVGLGPQGIKTRREAIAEQTFEKKLKKKTGKKALKGTEEEREAKRLVHKKIK